MRQHLQSIENYRGFAIICIVAVHCFHYGMSTTSGPWLAFQSFFYGSTCFIMSFTNAGQKQLTFI